MFHLLGGRRKGSITARNHLWTTISVQYPKLTSILKETLEPPKRKVVRTDGLTIVIYTTGDSPDSSVFLEISGGTDALNLKKEIEQQIMG